jgi:hypothetical protein
MSPVEIVTGTSAVGEALVAVNSPYPPSFDNNPLVFGWALFGRLLVLMLASATLFRIRARNQIECLPSNDPTYLKRLVIVCLLWSAVLGSLSDVLTYLFWGEVTLSMTQVILLISRLLDALTMFPFVMALSVSAWTAWLFSIGIMRRKSLRRVDMVFSDMRPVWISAAIPLRLMIYSAVGSAMVTVIKYWLWIEHGRP